jgi:hypothetical protein
VKRELPVLRRCLQRTPADDQRRLPRRVYGVEIVFQKLHVVRDHVGV